MQNIKEPTLSPSQQYSIKIGAGLSALLLFSTPFSTSISSIIPFLLLGLWLYTQQYLSFLQTIIHRPFVLFAFLLFCNFLIAMSYTSATPAEAFAILGKYRELLWLIVLIPFFQTDYGQRWGHIAFIAASTITLISSYAMYFNLIEAPNPAKAPVSIKTHITHGLFIAFFAFYCAHRIFYCSAQLKTFYVFCISLAILNLFFVVSGRTGQMIILLLAILFCFQKLSKKGIALSLLAISVLLFIFLNYSENAQRIIDGFTNIQSYFQAQEGNEQTSMGQRLNYWQYSLELIFQRPWLGFGTGSFSNEFLRIVPEGFVTTTNPHNEYLMISVQLGVIGLSLFLGFLISCLISSYKLKAPNKWLAQGLILSLAMNSIVNSSLLDHTEGHWFIALIALCYANLNASNLSNPDR